MNITKTLLSVGACAFLALGAAAAQAQNEETASLLLTKKTEVGGVVLEPGSYLIRVLPGNNRSVLTITNEDRSTTYATALTVPHTTAVTAAERAEQFVYFPATTNNPQVLRTWFPANSAVGGHDIAYPERRALELAPLAKGTVVAYKNDVKADQFGTAELIVVAPDRRITTYNVPMAPRTTEPPMVMADNSYVADRDELPRTAGNVPLLAALGVLLLLAGASIQIARA